MFRLFLLPAKHYAKCFTNINWFISRMSLMGEVTHSHTASMNESPYFNPSSLSSNPLLITAMLHSPGLAHRGCSVEMFVSFPLALK